MPLSAGIRLGAYEIVAPLGAGGMGEVYKARDTRLDRTVAIKILPAATADDPQRRERFRREARVISSLTHPHICTLHDIGEQNGIDYLVMEHLTGETLAHRLLRAALPLEEVLRIAIQLADALDEAHRHGVVHRDLKPANVMLTATGAKILDFGLAKWQGTDMDPAVSAALATANPTLTQIGSVVGTLQYMAPEQVEGKPADARSDLFALGAILYEMMTGKKAFEGASAASVMSAILTASPPPVVTLVPMTPPALDRLIRKCLAKDPAKRWQTAADLRDELAWIESDSSIRGAIGPVSTAVVQPRQKMARAAAVVAALAALAVGAFVAGRRTTGQTVTQPTFRPLTFSRGWIQTARFAPDGQTIVYSAAWEGRPLEMFATRRDSSESRSLNLPSGSIESISSAGDIAFIKGCDDAPECHDGVLTQAPLAGGPARELLEHVTYADWAPDGRDLAVIHHVNGRSRLESPIGRVLYEAPVGAKLEYVRFSRSGDRLAFSETSIGGGARSVSIIDLAGRRRQVLGSINYLFRGPEWSPHDDELWFSLSSPGNPTELYASSLDGRRRLIERTSQAMMIRDVAADGRVLINIRSEPRISRLVARSPGDADDRDLSVLSTAHVGDLSSDGRTVLFDDNAYGVRGGTRHVYLRPTDGSPAVRLGDGEAIALSHDGKTAIVATGSPVRLTLLPTGAGEARTLETPFEEWRWGFWARDAQHFIMDAREPGHGWRGYLHDVKGAAPRAITPEDIEPFLVSPDGKAVLASGSDRARSLALYPIDGGTPTPVRGLDPGDTPVQWMTDPRFLFVRAPGMYPARVFTFDIQTGRKALWKELAPKDMAGLFDVGRMDDRRRLFITPDGRAYAYTYLHVLSDLFVVEGLK
jgi:hypothetical protein